jgi:hypothetical protein
LVAWGRGLLKNTTLTLKSAIEAFIGVLALDELYYRLLLIRIKETTSQNPLDVLRKDPVGAIAVHGKTVEKAMVGFNCYCI